MARQYPPGKLVSGLTGEQTYYSAKENNLFSVLRLPDIPFQTFLSLFSVSGLTTYVGVNSVLKSPRKGETVIATAAVGATGSVAAQLVKLRGRCVIGVAGGSDKCQRSKSHPPPTVVVLGEQKVRVDRIEECVKSCPLE